MVNRLNLSLNDLRLIAERRDISDYEKKSAKDLIKALRGSRPRLGIKKNKLKEIKFLKDLICKRFLQFKTSVF